MLWKSNELRKAYLDFFEEKGHKIMPSSLLVDKSDPSVLLTTAGMQQFKPYFSGERNALKELGSRAITTSQKSFRTTDIDNIGDETHHTFFEMLGNFSLGDYHKKEAIEYAYNFLVNKLKIEKDRIYVTIFEGDKEVPCDKESVQIWGEYGFSEEKGNLKFFDREDNFWGPTGEEGPCGPTTEIYVDNVEIWNIVFNEFYMHKNKKLDTLEQKGIDTGMGLERLATVMQKKNNNFETDLFVPIFEIIDNYTENKDLKARRIIADHLKGAAFLMAEDLHPSNLREGYILRRVLRRAMRYVNVLGIENYNIYSDIFKTVGKIYKEQFPELLAKQDQMNEIFHKEYNVFGKALTKGLKIFEKSVKRLTSKEFPGKEAFFLYSTYGFPIELINDISKERDLELDEKGFKKALEEHREKSKN